MIDTKLAAAHGPPAREAGGMQDGLRDTIEAAWDSRESLRADSAAPEARAAVERALDRLASGEARVASPGPDGWMVHQWLKKAVLLSFRLADSVPMPGPGGAPVFDKVAMKFAGWDAARFAQAGFRAVPGAVVRRSAYIAPGVVLMPCFVNVGAHVGRGTMIDTWATVGSCAQVGADCHISRRRRPRRRAGAVAGQPGHYRRRLLYRRALGGGGGRDRRARQRAGDGRVPRRLDAKSSIASRAKFSSAGCRHIRWWCPARCPENRCRTARRGRASPAR